MPPLKCKLLFQYKHASFNKNLYHENGIMCMTHVLVLGVKQFTLLKYVSH